MCTNNKRQHVGTQIKLNALAWHKQWATLICQKLASSSSLVQRMAFIPGAAWKVWNITWVLSWKWWHNPQSAIWLEHQDPLWHTEQKSNRHSTRHFLFTCMWKETGHKTTLEPRTVGHYRREYAHTLTRYSHDCFYRVSNQKMKVCKTTLLQYFYKGPP